MKNIIILIGVLVLVFVSENHAQVANTGLMDTTSGLKIGNVSLGVYMDVYYGFNFNQPKSKQNNYFVSSNQHNSFQLNLAYLDLKFSDKRVRAHFVPAFGTYMNANYASEKGATKFILEGNIGVKLFKKKNIWLDAGVLGSPYTNESAVSKDHLMYSRSLSAEYVPYFLSGIKLSFPLGEKFTFYTYLVNGWQQIADKNDQKSIGTQLEYRPNKYHLVNWDTYVGNENMLTSFKDKMRYFSDIYWIFEKKKWKITSCAYAGIQEFKETWNPQSSYKYWWQANFIARYKLSENLSLSARTEFFNDPNNAVVPYILPSYYNLGFQCFSSGLSLGYAITDKCIFRIEGRFFQAGNEAFIRSNGTRTETEFQGFANLSIWF